MNVSTFTALNMTVVVGMLLLVTFLGHLLSKKASSASGFFTADGGLPWWAVSASLYATVLSAVSFISIPATVFRDGGNITFVQIVMGLALGKITLALLFARPYYELRNVDTVYDYLAVRISSPVANLAMILQIILSIMNSSIVVLSAALVLNILIDVSVSISCALIVGFAILWSCMGGLRTVVWTDAMLFMVLIVGALLSAWLSTTSSGLSFSEAYTALDQRAKLKLIDLSTDPSKSYTLWTGLITGTLLGMAIISSQGSMQRIRACKSLADAKKAFIFSSLLYITTLLLLVVGLGLSVFYAVNEIPTELAQRMQSQPDQVFPYFIIHEIPDGVSGIFIAAIFAAAISTLDSRLTELADISLANIYRRYVNKNASENHYVFMARAFLIVWGLIYCISSVSLSLIEGRNLLDLTWQVSNTLAGPILGTFLLARLGFGNLFSVAIGTLISVAFAIWLGQIGVTHFWWFPASVLAMLIIGRLSSRRAPD